MQPIKFYGNKNDLCEVAETLKKEGIEHEQTTIYGRGAEVSSREVIIISTAAFATLAKIAHSFFESRKRKFKFTSGRGILEMENPTEEEVHKALKSATAVYLSDEDKNESKN